MGGIYKILNSVNGKFYIGSTKDFSVRWTRHLSDLRAGRHHSRYLQRSYYKYGEGSFSLIPIEETENLFERESFWINKLNPEFNSGAVGGGDNLSNHPEKENIIKKMTKTLNEKISLMTKEERRLKWGRSGEKNPNWKGGISTKEIFCSGCGKKVSIGHSKCSKCTKIGDGNPFYGKKHSEEFKKSLSRKKTGIPNTHQNKKVRINGVEYRSMRDAAQALGVSVSLITYRFKRKYENYELIN